MNNCEHIIGLVYDYESATLATYEWLKKQYEDDLESVRHFRDNPEQDICDGIYLESATKRAAASHLVKILDKRNGRMNHFEFCPLCGAKIDWAALRKQAKEDVNA